jgi:outer membrane receptor protein involved in Fe transport
LDYVKTQPGDYSPQALAPPQSFTVANADDRSFDMFSLFATSELELTSEWTATAAIGHGQRAPTLIELYVDQTFIAGMQDGTNFYIGNPLLRKENATQMDVGLIADYTNLRGSARAFYAWVDDYITYDFVPGNLVSGYVFQNTSLAILSGFEVNGEFDLTKHLTAFGQTAYTEGRDQDINEPLFGIYPLQSRAGLRLQNGGQCSGWGVEFSSRVVDDQDRIARSLVEQTTPGFTTYDLRSYIRFSEAIMLTGGVENLTDKRYFEHYDYRFGLGDKMGGQLYPTFQRGRNFYVGMEARY